VNPAENSVTDGKTGLTAKKILPLLILAAGLAAFFAFGLDDYISLDALKENRTELAGWVAANGALAFIVYMALYTLVVAFSIPGGAIMTIAGGFLFGPILGTVLTVIGATVGAAVVFLAARYAFADLLRARAGAAIARMSDGFRRNAFSYMLFLRLIPVFPFFIVNLAPAFLGVGFMTYVVGTLIGIIPGTLVYALLGDGFSAVVEQGGDNDLGIIFAPRFLLPIVGLALLALLPIAYQKFRDGKGAAR